MKLLSSTLLLAFPLSASVHAVSSIRRDHWSLLNSRDAETCIAPTQQCNRFDHDAPPCCTSQDDPRSCQHPSFLGFKEPATCETCLLAAQRCTTDGTPCCSNSQVDLTCQHIDGTGFKDPYTCQTRKACIAPTQQCDRFDQDAPQCCTSDSDPRSCQHPIPGFKEPSKCLTCLTQSQVCTTDGTPCCSNSTVKLSCQAIDGTGPKDPYTCQITLETTN